jgi:hypothetical protein
MIDIILEPEHADIISQDEAECFGIEEISDKTPDLVEEFGMFAECA